MNTESSRFLRAALIMIVMLGAALSSTLTTNASAGANPLQYTVENGLLKLNTTAYEIVLSEKNGSIVTITDKATGKTVIDNPASPDLWVASLKSGAPIGANVASTFTPQWNAQRSTLTLTYTGAVNVIVTINAADANSLSLSAKVKNTGGVVITSFSFPNGMQFRSSTVQDALMPLMPGALLDKSFFEKGTYVNEYPGAMFADYLGLRSTDGQIALYAQRGDVLQPAFIGYEHVSGDTPYSKFTHNLRTWIADKTMWTSPTVVIRVGQDYPTTIAHYRTENGIDKYKSIRTKLGKLAPTYFASPMYKLDLTQIRKTFAEMKSAIIDQMPFPGIIHPVGFQNGGFDNGYPDFVPPAEKWGSSADFADFVEYVHDKGGLVVPYTNFSWWDDQGATMLHLPATVKVSDIVASGADKSIIIEKYGPNVGFVMDLNHPFVKAKIAEQHRKLTSLIGVDGIFEDQWGVRNAPYNFAPTALKHDDPSVSYFQGVLDHYRAQSASRLMTEQGVDALAEYGVGFMGTNYLWDQLGYRGATANFTRYYPMAGMLFRDKVLLYQHDLDAATWTKNSDMLRWNLSQGYNLSQDFFNKGIGAFNIDNPWLNLIAVFQKYTLANYADEPVTAFEILEGGITRTTFTNYEVYANWNTDSSYKVNGHTLPAGGVVTQAKDGSVTAGNFTTYNGTVLSEGEHYLVEVRDAKGVRVFQPIGVDTSLTLIVPDGKVVTLTAYQINGAMIKAVPFERTSTGVEFIYSMTIDDHKVGYYQITYTDR